ncbi:ORF6C domain-containing protein [Paenibacillus ginsengarvi]|nr:ORF6C domain-containing protein [Paenibacillus ginsengarvi]
MSEKQLAPMDRWDIMLRTSENMINKIQDHDLRLVSLEKRMDKVPADYRQIQNIHKCAVERVTALLGGYGTPRYKAEFRKTIARLWKDYKSLFGIVSYHDTPTGLYDQAISYIQHWNGPIEVVGEKVERIG